MSNPPIQGTTSQHGMGFRVLVTSVPYLVDIARSIITCAPRNMYTSRVAMLSGFVVTARGLLFFLLRY